MIKLTKEPAPGVMRRFTTALWYSNDISAGDGTATLTTVARINLVPFTLGITQAFVGMACVSTIAAEAGVTVRYAIYSDTGGVPGAVFWQSPAALAADAVAGPIYDLTMSLSLTPGLWWLGVKSETDTGTKTQPTVIVTAAGSTAHNFTGAAAPAANTWSSGLIKNSADAGAFPATAPAMTASVSVMPKLWLKTA